MTLNDSPVLCFGPSHIHSYFNCFSVKLTFCCLAVVLFLLLFLFIDVHFFLMLLESFNRSLKFIMLTTMPASQYSIRHPLPPEQNKYLSSWAPSLPVFAQYEKCLFKTRHQCNATKHNNPIVYVKGLLKQLFSSSVIVDTWQEAYKKWKEHILTSPKGHILIIKETNYTKKLVYLKSFQHNSKTGPLPTLTNTKIEIWPNLLSIESEANSMVAIRSKEL